MAKFLPGKKINVLLTERQTKKYLLLPIIALLYFQSNIGLQIRMPTQLTLNKSILEGANYIMINYFIVHYVPFRSKQMGYRSFWYESIARSEKQDIFKDICDVCFLYFKLTNCVFKELCSFLFRHIIHGKYEKNVFHRYWLLLSK